MSNKIVCLEDYKDSQEPHAVSELMCVKCLFRYVGVYPVKMLLKDAYCEKCGSVGTIINTGQILEQEVE